MYWNEFYESFTYSESEEALFTRWLEEYQQDRAAHQEKRSAHPDPAKLDDDFYKAFVKLAWVPQNITGAALEVATNILLSGARATTCLASVECVEGQYRLHSLRYPDYVEGACCTGPIRYSVDVPDGDAHLAKWDTFGKYCSRFQNGRDWGKSLRDVAYIVADDLWKAKGPTPELEAFLDALAASGSVALLTNTCMDGGGGFVLDQLLDMTIYRGSYGFGCVKTHRMGLRLLARMSFLSAEQALAVGCTHPFMALIRIRPRSPASYPVEYIVNRYLKCCVDDAILQVLYLTMFMYRRYPWPRQQRYRVETTIAKWVEWVEVDCNRPSIVKETLAWAMLLPGFFQVLVEDDSIWFLLAAFDIEQRVASGKKRGFFLNTTFSSRQRESRIIGELKNNRLLSAWMCGKDNRHLLQEVCRQRRRRVVKVRVASAPQKACFGPNTICFCWSIVLNNCDSRA